MSSKNRKFGPPWLGGRAVAKLSLSAQVKEFCWAEGRLAVGYLYSIISLVQKEKDVNEPLGLPSSV